MEIPKYLHAIIENYEKLGGYSLAQLEEKSEPPATLKIPVSAQEYYMAKGYLQAMYLEMSRNIKKLPRITIPEKEKLSQEISEKLSIEAERIVKETIKDAFNQESGN